MPCGVGKRSPQPVIQLMKMNETNAPVMAANIRTPVTSMSRRILDEVTSARRSRSRDVFAVYAMFGPPKWLRVSTY